MKESVNSVQIKLQNKAEQQRSIKNMKQSKQLCTLPSFVYFSLASSDPLKKYLQGIKKQIKQIIDQYQTKDSVNYIQFEQINEKDLHISLSKIFRLFIKDQQIFQTQLRKQIRSKYGSNILLPISFKGINVLLNQYVILEIDEGEFKNRLISLGKVIDDMLIKWKFQEYYQNPIYHITLFKIKIKLPQTNQENQNRDEKKQKQVLQHLFKQLEAIKINRRTCYNCKDLCLKIGNKIRKLK